MGDYENKSSVQYLYVIQYNSTGFNIRDDNKQQSNAIVNHYEDY